MISFYEQVERNKPGWGCDGEADYQDPGWVIQPVACTPRVDALVAKDPPRASNQGGDRRVRPSCIWYDVCLQRLTYR
jgi:hypothetical protein